MSSNIIKLNGQILLYMFKWTNHFLRSLLNLYIFSRTHRKKNDHHTWNIMEDDKI